MHNSEMTSRGERVSRTNQRMGSALDDDSEFTIHFELFFCREGTENVRKSFVIIEAHLRRYRLGVRTEDSQSSNPGSIPGSATRYHPRRARRALIFPF
jgi:hypothetical protein